MNYQKIYQQLIDRARFRNITGYKETHHIVPRCLGGSDDASNLVELTPEEHYIAHQLLVKIHTNDRRLLYAAVMMCSNRINNKLYGWLRRRLSEARSNAMTGSGNSMFNRRWISNEFETKLVDSTEASTLVDSGKYITGKVAKRAECGCLVKNRCVLHENKRQATTYQKKLEFEKRPKQCSMNF